MSRNVDETKTQTVFQAAGIVTFHIRGQEPDYPSFRRFSSGQSYPYADINIVLTNSLVHAG